MGSYTTEEVNLTKTELAKAEKLGTFIKANPPSIQGIGAPNPRTITQDGMLIDYDVPIPTRDGAILRGNIFRPETWSKGQSLPILLNYSVYGKDDVLELCMFPTSSGLDQGRVSKYYPFEASDPIWWTSQGYAVAFVDARGSFMSEGNKHYYSRDVGLDGADAVQWLGALPWSNGKVGMYGASAFAMVQWIIAAEQPSCLGAIVPFDGMTDLYREMARKGGIPETQFMEVYPHLYNWGHGMVEESSKAHFVHPFFDEYWQNKIPNLAKITCPAYVVSGWGDHGIHTRGTLNSYLGISSKHKYLEIHGFQKWEWAVTGESLGRQKAFYDTHLLGKATEVQFWPPVRWMMREAYYVGEWRQADKFPFPKTQYRKLYPTVSKSLGDVADPTQQSFEYDALKGEVALELPIIQSLEFAGHAKLRLWVEAKGADNMDMHITLRKINAQGETVTFPWLTINKDGPVAFGWLRVSRRELDESRSTDIVPHHLHARDLLLKPGEVVPIDIEILPTSCRFRPSERLQVVISGHDYGTYAPNLPLARHADTPNKGTHVIHFGGKYDSYLQLPIIPPVKSSMQQHGRLVKMAVAANRVQGWSDDKILQEYTKVNAGMLKGMSGPIPFLRALTQVASVPNSQFQPLGFGANANKEYELSTITAFSTIAKTGGVLHNPQFLAAAGSHVFTDPASVGSLCQVGGELMFDPVGFEKRGEDSVLVTVYIPRNSAAKVPAGEPVSDAVLQQRVDAVRNAAAGTGVLRYVINRDITPKEPKGFFAGTPYATTEWGGVGAVEEYWFANVDSAAKFFGDEGRVKALSSSAGEELDVAKAISVAGKEGRIFAKDPEF